MQVPSLPRYRQLANELKTRINSGFYDEIGLLPRERDLESEFAVGRNTVRGALKVLCDKEIITKIQGKGSVLNRSAQKNGEYIVLTYDIPYKSSYIINMLHEIEKWTAEHSDFVSYMQLAGKAQNKIDFVIKRIKEHKNLKGVILLGGYTRKILRKIVASGLPMVMVGDPRAKDRINDPVISQVVGDNYEMIYKVTDFLLKRKFRRIALIAPPKDLIIGKSYLNGYQEALQDNNIKFQQKYCYILSDYQNYPKYVAMEKEQQLRKLFTLDELPEVLIANANFYAIAKEIASEYKIRIPEDIIIITTLSSPDLPDKIPCLFTKLNRIILEVFDLLEQEQKNNNSVRQRRSVKATLVNHKNIIAKPNKGE